MIEAGVVGIARVGMHTKEHLAALVLNTIRWASEIRALDDLKLPAAGKNAAGLKMAAQPIGDMTGPWDAQAYTGKFSAAVQALVIKKVAAGETETVTPLEETPSAGGAGNVVDLTELLAASLAKRMPVGGAARSEGHGAVAARTQVVKAPPKKRA